MAIEFGCPVCGGTLRVEDDAIGQVVRCGGCMSMLRVPEPAGPEPQFPSTPGSPFPESPRPAFPESPSLPPSTRSSARERKRAEEPDPKNERIREQSPQRRRKPRRPEPPPPSPPGRGKAFWVLITLGVLGISSCFFCCGLYPVVSAPKWQSYQSPKGGFEVELPAAPKSPFTIRGINQVMFSVRGMNHVKSPKYEIEGSRIWARGEDYAILYKDISSIRDRKGKDEEVFKVAERDLTDMGFINLGDGISIEKSTYPARGYHCQSTAGGVYVVRTIVVGSRLYILVVGGVMNHLEQEYYQRFFSSFTVTDEKLKNEVESWPVMMLGMALADRTTQTIAEQNKQNEVRENKLGEVREQGISIARALVQAIDVHVAGKRTHEQAAFIASAFAQAINAHAEGKKSHGLGVTLSNYLGQVIETELARVEERKRIANQGLKIGKAIAGAIEADFR